MGYPPDSGIREVDESHKDRRPDLMRSVVAFARDLTNVYLVGHCPYAVSHNILTSPAVVGVDTDYLPDRTGIGAATVDQLSSHNYLVLPEKHIVRAFEANWLNHLRPSSGRK